MILFTVNFLIFAMPGTSAWGNFINVGGIFFLLYDELFKFDLWMHFFLVLYTVSSVWVL